VSRSVVEVEQSVLGALLLDNSAWDRIVDLVGENDFYRSDHRLIFRHIALLIEENKAADALTVAEGLERGGDLAAVGGQTYIGSLPLNTPSAAGIHRYAEIVRDRARLRRLQAAASDVLEKAQAPGADSRVIAEDAEAAFLSVLDADFRTGEPLSFASAIAQAIDARDAQRGEVVPTGFARLDRKLKSGGFEPGQLVIVAGRPGMAKTALVANLAEHRARTHPVIFFTMEMSARELADRSLSYHESLLPRDEAAMHLMGLHLIIDETPAITISHMRLRCRRMKRKHGLSLIVVDYLQLMRGKGENRTQEIGSISRGLKALAKEFNAPIIAVAQINRGVENRTDRRPLLSDLRESGDIEADADIVMMLYRDDYYDRESAATGIAEVIVRKQRNGPMGTVFLRFQAELTRFHTYEGDAPRSTSSSKRSATNFSEYKSHAAGEA
jgi:replicative DNA helicase